MTLLIFFLLYAVGLSIGLARNVHRQGVHPSSVAPRQRPERVLIVGATGGTGRQLVAQALERGFMVTALVRDPSRLPVDHPRLRVVRGDVMDATSVEAAMQNQDVVLSALGHRRYFYPTRILSQGTSNILRAMETCHVGRMVCQTSLGIGDSVGRMGLYYTFLVIPLILPFYFWDKTRQERIIARSSVDWVLVRPAALTNGSKRGRIRQGSRVRAPGGEYVPRGWVGELT